MTPEDLKTAVDDRLKATRATDSSPAAIGDAADGVRTPWRWAAGAIIVLAAAAEIAWFVGRNGGVDEERRRQIQAMSPPERAALAAKFERFQKLEPEEQRRLRELHAAFESDAAPEALRTTLALYETWVGQLPPQLSAQLVGAPPEDRAVKVAEIVAEQREAAAKSFSEADSRVLIAWLEKQARLRQEEIMSQLPQTMRERLENMRPHDRTWYLIFIAISQRGPGPSLFGRPAELADLRSGLSDRAKAEWDAASGNADEFKLLLGGWTRQAVGRYMSRDNGPSSRMSEGQLLEFFNRELSEEDRNRLLAMPREAMMLELRREYDQRKEPWREGYWRPFGRRSGDGIPGNSHDGGSGDGRPAMGGPRPFGQRPGGFGPRPGGTPGGTGPAGNPSGPNLRPPRPNNGVPTPPRPQA